MFEEQEADDILMGNVMCTKNDSHILECAHISKSNDRDKILDQCNDHAGVICQGDWLQFILTLDLLPKYIEKCDYIVLFLGASTHPGNCTTGKIRLVVNSSDFSPSNTTIEGRLEICINNAWGTVCLDQYFDALDAAAVCRQLGNFDSTGINIYILN